VDGRGHPTDHEEGDLGAFERLERGIEGREQLLLVGVFVFGGALVAMRHAPSYPVPRAS